MAVQSPSILALPSKMLGCAIGAIFKANAAAGGEP